MAQEAKTKSAPLDRAAFLARIESDQRRADAQALLQLFQQVTGWQPQLWGPSIIGFGRYAYRYESGHGGEWFATGFSPRKTELTIYIMPGYADFDPILARLGSHRLGKSCLYIRRLDKVDQGVLEELVRAGLQDLAKRWTIHPL